MTRLANSFSKYLKKEKLSLERSCSKLIDEYYNIQKENESYDMYNDNLVVIIEYCNSNYSNKGEENLVTTTSLEEWYEKAKNEENILEIIDRGTTKNCSDAILYVANDTQKTGLHF
ncbi:hypothetical protein [endosymbiont GvMRE of Glomus versiforme]|uniref:hypothetical protein n=1 Tax=endosymbiont GvMRE of Glomus versiforme TaxID=2039283 RepID=UPI0011C36ED5|nr:hypothetical protein [endosymbiont GvMRE of Glomus versiforme]